VVGGGGLCGVWVHLLYQKGIGSRKKTTLLLLQKEGGQLISIRKSAMIRSGKGKKEDTRNLTSQNGRGGRGRLSFFTPEGVSTDLHRKEGSYRANRKRVSRGEEMRISPCGEKG